MTETKNGNKIFLTEEDAKIYLSFKKHREKFITLLNAEVFDVESGKVEINCHNSQIQNIHIHRLVYKKVAKNDIV